MGKLNKFEKAQRGMTLVIDITPQKVNGRFHLEVIDTTLSELVINISRYFKGDQIHEKKLLGS